MENPELAFQNADAGPEPISNAGDHTQHLPSRIAVQVDARGFTLAVLATIAFIFAVHFAKNFLVPLLLGILIAYTLNPLVTWLTRIWIPRWIGASLVLLLILLGAAAGASTLFDEFQSILDELPPAAHKLSRTITEMQKGRASTIQKVQKAATEIEQATTPPTSNSTRMEPKPVAPNQPAIKIKDMLWAGSLGLLSFAGEAAMAAFLVFFFLLYGGTFKRKLVKLTGPSLSRKKITVHILDDINTSVQNYMFMLLVTNLLLAMLMWIALRSIGLANAGAWALAAGLLHVIPYFGPLLILLLTSVATFLQFESLAKALITAACSLTISTLVGMFVTTWMAGKIAKMNPAAVFIALLFWGWLWDVWGLLLGIPIIVIVKVVSEHVEGLQPVAELLSE
jgi:predicted PurR-regulated permease PerM